MIPLAKSIYIKKLPYTIIITINPNESKLAREFLCKLKENNLEKIILNVGTVPFSKVNSLFSKVDALLLPTLMETYCIPYFEAMAAQKTILTSNLPFAKEVCKESAYYFNPFDEKDILSNIMKAFRNKELKNKKLEIGLNIYRSVISWHQFLSIILEDF